jgi:hypothetical protein
MIRLRDNQSAREICQNKWRRSKAVPTSNVVDSTPTIQDNYGFNKLMVDKNAKANTRVSAVKSCDALRAKASSKARYSGWLGSAPIGAPSATTGSWTESLVCLGGRSRRHEGIPAVVGHKIAGQMPARRPCILFSSWTFVGLAGLASCCWGASAEGTEMQAC